MILDPRGGDAGRLAQRVAPRRAAPHPLAPVADRKGGLRDTLLRLAERLPLDWRRAPAVVRGALRKARLGSKQRRFAGEVAWELVRYDRLLRFLIERGGGRDDAASRLRAALVLFFGLPRSGEPWGTVADPAHALLGWVLSEGPAPHEALARAGSLTDDLARRLWLVYGDDVCSLVPSLAERAPLWLRVNTLRAERDAVLDELRDAGLDARPGPWSERAIELLGSPNVRGLPAFAEGRVEVQDLGSQILADCVAALPGEVVVDACAGAGGKALALGAALGGTGQLLAADVRPAALAEARKRAARAGLGGMRTVELAPRGPLPGGLRKLRGGVDAVLVDAPCSGTGALRRNPESRWTLPPTELPRLVALQGSILDRFAPLLRPGGRMVYATCSLLPEENVEVVDAFLARTPGWRREPLRLPDELLRDGALALRPDRHRCDGFGAALLRRG